MKQNKWIAFVLAGGMLLASCGKSDEANNESGEESTEQTSESSSSNENNVSTANVEAPVVAGPAIAATTLKGFLPGTVGSYKPEGEAETMQTKMGEFEYSYAKQEYTNGDKRIQVTLGDYNMVESLTAGYSVLMNMSMESNTEVTKGEKFQGKPGYVSYHKDGSRAQLGVGVNNRVWLVLEGDNGASIDDLRAAVSSMDLNAIAGAK